MPSLHADRLRALRWPVASLPARITTLAVAATVATSLAITWTSVRSLDAFLGARVDEKFPLALLHAADRIDGWHSGVHRDVETFARSETLVSGTPALLTRDDARARREIETYLSFVLERFAHFEALFVLDGEGQERLWIGPERRLPPRTLEQLSGAVGQLVSVTRPGGDLDQIATAQISDAAGKPVGTLHAVVRVDDLAAQLGSQHLTHSGALIVTLADGTIVHDTQGRPTQPQRPGVRPGVAPVTRSYSGPDGERLIGAAIHVPSLNWFVHAEEPHGDAFAPIRRVVRQILTLNLLIVFVFGLIAFRLAASVVRPLRALGEGARRVAEGATDVRVEVAGTTDEVALLARTFNSMTERLGQQREQIERTAETLRLKNQELERLSITDELTGLHNHRHFQEQLAADVRRADRSGYELSLLLLDIDDFKRLNDTYGHAAGDAVLQNVAEIIRGVLRDSDLPARYGGEEFAILLDAGLEGASSLAERLRLAISESPVRLVGDGDSFEVSVTVSIGVAAYAGSRAELFNRADAALYRAKTAGKNCVEIDGAD